MYRRLASYICYDATLLICLESEQLSHIGTDHCFFIYMYIHLNREKFHMSAYTIDSALSEKVV